MASLLKKQDRDGGRDRRWRANFKKVQRELTTLEEDEYQLDRVFPQVGAAAAAAGRAGGGGSALRPPGAGLCGRGVPCSAEGTAAAAAPGCGTLRAGQAAGAP
jgi:hypothetical protein